MIKTNDFGLLILRLSIGGLMLFHGVSKVFAGVEGIAGMLDTKGIPGFVAYGVFVGELIAPLLIFVGYRTRLAALVLSVNMLVILFLAHANDLLALSPHGGWKPELSGLYLFGALALLFTGSGKIAISNSSRWD